MISSFCSYLLQLWKQGPTDKVIWELLALLACGFGEEPGCTPGSLGWESVRAQLTLCRACAGVPMGKPRRRTMHGALEMMRTM